MLESSLFSAGILFTFCDLTSDQWLTYFDTNLTLHVTYCLSFFAIITNHVQINYIDTKDKCRHLKKLTCKATGVYQSEAPSHPMTPLPPYTLFTYLHREGGGELNQ
jgi:hypothetical protein